MNNNLPLGMLQKLKNGQNVYGTAFTSIAPSWPIIVKNAGLDFVFIDTEHISMNRADMAKFRPEMQKFYLNKTPRFN